MFDLRKEIELMDNVIHYSQGKDVLLKSSKYTTFENINDLIELRNGLAKIYNEYELNKKIVQNQKSMISDLHNQNEELKMKNIIYRNENKYLKLKLSKLEKSIDEAYSKYYKEVDHV